MCGWAWSCKHPSQTVSLGQAWHTTQRAGQRQRSRCEKMGRRLPWAFITKIYYILNKKELPPSIDANAALRWQALPLAESPWLHEEVAQRMAQRLEWITLQPQQWLHWQPSKGGVQAHGVLRQRYPQAQAWVYEPHGAQQALLQRLEAQAQAGWLQRTLSKWRAPSTFVGLPEAGTVDMLWANMALHTSADPQALLAQWREVLAPNGFVMFSALGPDTLQELRALYQQLGWPAPCHAFTDMHDWGDMLVQAGFAEPVMDMERITLTFATPERLLQELRGLGRNLSNARGTVTRGQHWQQQLLEGLRGMAQDGVIPLTFEVIYGHALQAPKRHQVAGTTEISLQDMQSMLRKEQP